jgi:hypothetical protein
VNPKVLAKAQRIALKMQEDGVPDASIDAYLRAKINMGLMDVLSSEPRDSPKGQPDEPVRRPQPVNPEVLAKARMIAVKMQHDGVDPAAIDQYLKAHINMGLQDVMSPKLRDYLRAAGMGATFGFEDELAGLGAALVPGGQGYTEARNAVRHNAEAASAVAPKRMLAAELGGGLASSLAGGAVLGAETAGARLGARLAAGAAGGAAAGGTAGLGYSEDHPLASTAIGAGLGATLGVGLPLVGAGVGKAGNALLNRFNPLRTVARALSNLLPADAEATMAAREALAPGADPSGLSCQSGIAAGSGHWIGWRVAELPDLEICAPDYWPDGGSGSGWNDRPGHTPTPGEVLEAALGLIPGPLHCVPGISCRDPIAPIRQQSRGPKPSTQSDKASRTDEAGPGRMARSTECFVENTAFVNEDVMAPLAAGALGMLGLSYGSDALARRAFADAISLEAASARAAADVPGLVRFGHLAEGASTAVAWAGLVAVGSAVVYYGTTGLACLANPSFGASRQ